MVLTYSFWGHILNWTPLRELTRYPTLIIMSRLKYWTLYTLLSLAVVAKNATTESAFNSPPFDNVELDITNFDPKKKQIIHSYVNLFRSEEYVYQKVKTPSPEADISPGEKFILQEVIRTEF